MNVAESNEIESRYFQAKDPVVGSIYSVSHPELNSVITGFSLWYSFTECEPRFDDFYPQLDKMIKPSGVLGNAHMLLVVSTASKFLTWRAGPKSTWTL